MNLTIKRKNGYYKLVDLDTNIVLMVASKHMLNQSYRIIDWRLTKQETTASEFLDDIEIQRIKLKEFKKHEHLFDFPVEHFMNGEHALVRWRDMEGVLLGGGDRVDKEFDFATEAHVWSYKASMAKLKECKLFWEKNGGHYDDYIKPNIKHRPTRSDFW